MELNEFKLLQQFKKRSRTLVPQQFLMNGMKERTLLWGYWTDRADHHLYIYGGKFHLIIGESLLAVTRERQEKAHFEYSAIRLNDVVTNRTEISEDKVPLIPNKRLCPDACDFHFCQRLIENGILLPFTKFNENRQESQYHGPVNHQL